MFSPAPWSTPAMPRILAAIFVFAVLSMAPVLGALAQALPQEMMQQIGAAAEQGRQHRAALSDIIDERRQTANRQLETVVVAAISQRPTDRVNWRVSSASSSPPLRQ